MTLRVLVVCTANICRSPVAAAALDRECRSRGHDASVTSAGTHGGRLGMHRDTLRAASAHGFDLDGHVSRRLTADIVDREGADLIVAMTRAHLREVVGLSPAAWPHAFTLKELARRALATPPTSDVSSWVASLAHGRRTADLMGDSPDDDLVDPYGGLAAGHVEMVDDVVRLAGHVVGAFPTRPG